ncbi:hypothetical protein KVR01_000064 [Diaporthe batatas]|uniref:uncharacterized protein n=1 Tax=Diaporthe batatas TaxID=748121 RepID=UPI001D03C7F2|nr:uncharacterized protein KVR01_000064 [Diaporthe batatas]KAG8169319.1 hypothetical protein KVR01_000064 [Diaporthe batatas]
MPVKPPVRWTSRSLTVMFLPEMFRKARNFAEAIGPIKEKVPVDADLNHYFIKRKQEKMTKAICREYKLNVEKPPETPKGYIWSVATGEWVAPHRLKLDTFFPFALGPMVAFAVSARISFREHYNGLLLPPSIWAAYNNWKLAIAPQKEHLYEKTPKAYQFRVLDKGPEILKPVYPDSQLKVEDLDRKPLQLRSTRSATTPNPHSLYFQSCCAVWKLTHLEQPDRSPEEFWERFQYKMDGLWGTLGDRKRVLDIFKPPELLTAQENDERAAEAAAVIASPPEEPPLEDEPSFEDVLDKASAHTDITSKKAIF